MTCGFCGVSRFVGPETHVLVCHACGVTSVRQALDLSELCTAAALGAARAMAFDEALAAVNTVFEAAYVVERFERAICKAGGLSDD